MNVEQQQQFAFITKSLSELAMASQSIVTRDAAQAAMPILIAHASGVFSNFGDGMIAVTAKRAATMTTIISVQGPLLWGELHTRAKNNPADAVAEMAYLTSFAERLPCGDCRQFYKQYLQSFPPNFEDYQGWVIQLHNAVNKKLGKPELPDAQARALWR